MQSAVNVPLPEFRLPSCNEECTKDYPGARWVRLEKHPVLPNLYFLPASSEHAYLHSVAALKETSLEDHFQKPSFISVPQDAKLGHHFMIFSGKVQLPCWPSGPQFGKSDQILSRNCCKDWMNLFESNHMRGNSTVHYLFRPLYVKKHDLPENTFLFALVAPLQQTPAERACSRYVTN
jgi:hypothetical protein